MDRTAPEWYLEHSATVRLGSRPKVHNFSYLQPEQYSERPNPGALSCCSGSTTLRHLWTSSPPIGERCFLKTRAYFFDCSWFEVYDFIEFVAKNHMHDTDFKDGFTRACNQLFEKEMSGYRFVDGLVTRITEAQELDEIQEAIDEGQGPVSQHLRRALELLSDRTAPDYRNSIKESISGVESLVATTVRDRGTLGQLIKRLEDEIGLHPALKNAFSSLYGYTSDEWNPPRTH